MKLRRWFQTSSLFLLSLGPLFQAKEVCLPILHCHSCPLASFSCPLGIIGHYITIVGAIPLFMIGTILLIGALIGRAMCGWVCPFGFLQELLYKIPGPKFTLWRPLRLIKYVVLVVTVFLVPVILGMDSWLYFCRLCPAATLEASLPYAVMQGGSSSLIIRFSILAVFLIFSMFTLRFFCRVFCPMGAIASFLNPISAFALRQDTESCVQCAKCASSCPVGVDLQQEPDDVKYKAPLDCILCLDCTKECPIQGGLKGSFLGKIRKNGQVPVCSCPETVEVESKVD